MSDTENTENTDNASEVIADQASPEGADAAEKRQKIAAFGDISVDVSVVLGKVSMPVQQFLKLSRGAIVELPCHKDDNADLYVNETLVAKGEIMLAGDNVGISVTQVLKKKSPSPVATDEIVTQE